jgi:hypothetical protein
MSTQTISKWGSSPALRLPAAFAKQMRLEEGDKVADTIRIRVRYAHNPDTCGRLGWAISGEGRRAIGVRSAPLQHALKLSGAVHDCSVLQPASGV